jgi:hypothetical protein
LRAPGRADFARWRLKWAELVVLGQTKLGLPAAPSEPLPKVLKSSML